MSTAKDQLEAIQDIRKMMQESSKFLSLSGFSGVFAGVFALLGAYLGHLSFTQFLHGENIFRLVEATDENILLISILICIKVLALSILVALIFSARKAKKNKVKLFDKTTSKLFIHFSIPLAVGGMFCLALLYHGGNFIYLVSPCMLLFYGLALINGSKYTFHEIKILGILQIILGICALFFLGYGLLFWSIGFGVLHIVYGILVWYKHERN